MSARDFAGVEARLWPSPSLRNSAKTVVPNALSRGSVWEPSNSPPPAEQASFCLQGAKIG